MLATNVNFLIKMKRQFLSSVLLILQLGFLLLSSPSNAATLAKDRMWPPGSIINVLFLDGSPEQMDRVRAVAPLWLVESSLVFRFFESPKEAPALTHIRISFFNQSGSRLGAHGDYQSLDATMQLAELNHYDLESSLAQRYILHEFGHALGLEHEYRNPRWPYGEKAIEEHIERCIPRLQNNAFNKEEAAVRCNEINTKLDSSNSHFTAYDKLSIMNYPQSITLEEGQKVLIKATTRLSILDKLAISRWYGKKN
ncbi:hypothetical protein [Aliikangiella sp. G2MR2-5]|uniref:hypothetical protein n=1 Tax=Aliikangiella sp. G2MR2-5 TaxID=2788943 RepID=UPI001AEEA98D|nr:hypothetical protein [Aliikangiella sp. G2MR2-5]